MLFPVFLGPLSLLGLTSLFNEAKRGDKHCHSHKPEPAKPCEDNAKPCQKTATIETKITW